MSLFSRSKRQPDQTDPQRPSEPEIPASGEPAGTVSGGADAPAAAPVHADTHAPRLAAGEDPADRRPTILRRGQLRKRLRFLERARELQLRDLGGLVYEVHRSGSDGEREHHRSLIAQKVQRLGVADREMHEIASWLGSSSSERVLREPGIGGTCPSCAELYGSDARFCSRCGSPVHAVVTRTPAAPAPASEPVTVTPLAEPILTDDAPTQQWKTGERSEVSEQAARPSGDTARP